MASELVPPAAKIESGPKKLCWSRASIDAVDAEAFNLSRGARCRGAAISLRCGGLQAANPFSGMNSNHSRLDDFTEGGAILRGTSKSSFRRQPKRHSTGAATRVKRPKRPAAGSLAQTRNLVLAALRVWELKHGIR